MNILITKLNIYAKVYNICACMYIKEIQTF